MMKVNTFYRPFIIITGDDYEKNVEQDHGPVQPSNVTFNITL